MSLQVLFSECVYHTRTAHSELLSAGLMGVHYIIDSGLNIFDIGVHNKNAFSLFAALNLSSRSLIIHFFHLKHKKDSTEVRTFA